MLVARKTHLFQLIIINKVFFLRIVVFKFIEKDIILWQFGKMKFVWVVIVLIGEESLLFALLIGFGKGVQSCCSIQNNHYFENLQISKRKRH